MTPDRDSLERALRNADAAGDVDAARELAKAIRGLPTFGSEAKAVGSQALYAVPGLIGGIADLGDFAGKKIGGWFRGLGIPEIPDVTSTFPETKRSGAASPSGVITEMIGAPREPQTPGGKMTAEGVKGLVLGLGAAGPAARAIPRMATTAALTGAGGGVGGESAAQFFDESPWARILGSVAGSLGTGLLMRGGESLASGMGASSPQTGNRLQKGLEGVSQAELAQARVGMDRAAGLGIPTTIPQNIPRPTGLSGLQDEVVGSEHGAGLTKFLSFQDEAAAQAARQGVARQGPAMAPEAAATRGADAARGHLEGLRQLQQQNTAPFYEKVAPVAKTEDVYNAYLGLRNAAQAAGENTNAGQALNRAARGLWEQANPNAPGTTLLRDSNLIDSVRQQLRDDLATKAGFRAEQIASGSKPLDDLFATVTRDLKGGNAMHAAIERQVIEPAKRGLVGQIATEADTPGQVSKIAALFNKDRVNSQSILQLQGQLHRQDPEAFPALVRGWMGTNAEKYLATGKGGMLDPEGAGKFANAIGGAPGSAARENFKAAIAGVARARGVNEASAVAGAERWLEALRSTQIGKSQMPSFRPDFGTAGENAAAALAGYHLQAAPQSLLRSLGEIWHGKSSREIGEVLTSPDGVKYLSQLARLPRNPRTSIAIRSTMANIFEDSQEK